MKATQRYYRTDDGKLVGAEDPNATSLAYAVGDEVSAEDAKTLQASQGDDSGTSAGDTNATPGQGNVTTTGEATSGKSTDRATNKGNGARREDK